MTERTDDRTNAWMGGWMRERGRVCGTRGQLHTCSRPRGFCLSVRRTSCVRRKQTQEHALGPRRDIRMELQRSRDRSIASDREIERERRRAPVNEVLQYHGRRRLERGREERKGQDVVEGCGCGGSVSVSEGCDQQRQRPWRHGDAPLAESALRRSNKASVEASSSMAHSEQGRARTHARRR